MRTALKSLALAAALLAPLAASRPAEAYYGGHVGIGFGGGYGGWHGGYYGHYGYRGYGWGGPRVGVGIDLVAPLGYYDPWFGPYPYGAAYYAPPVVYAPPVYEPGYAAPAYAPPAYAPPAPATYTPAIYSGAVGIEAGQCNRGALANIAGAQGTVGGVYVAGLGAPRLNAPMDVLDQACVAGALELARTGGTVRWTGAGGTPYEVTIVRTWYGAQNQPCREFRVTARSSGLSSVGRACRAQDSSWRAA